MGERGMKWKMRTVAIVRNGNYTHSHWLKLKCGHVVTPRWNGKTFYIPGKTKSRCYECAGSIKR
jgi:hypothetical protein